MVCHETIAVETKRVPLLGLGQGGKECLVILGTGEDAIPVIAPIQGMKDKAVLNWSRKSPHETNLPGRNDSSKRE